MLKHFSFHFFRGIIMNKIQNGDSVRVVAAPCKKHYQFNSPVQWPSDMVFLAGTTATVKELSAYPDFYTAEFVSGRTRIIHKDDLELLDKCVDCK